MGNNGIAGCTGVSPPINNLQNMTSINLGTCTICPANFYQNCTGNLGPEWAFDYSQSEGAGCKAVCKRVDYTNNSDDCCMHIQSPNLTSTCNPNLNASNPKCYGPIANYCSKDENINSDFCTSLPIPLDTLVLSKYCNNTDNIKNKQMCRNFVSNINNAGKVDDLMSRYCVFNPNDDLCCFMNSTIPCPNKFDVRCFNKASYQTSAMLATPCPNVLNCYQYANLSPSSKLFATNIQQNCGTTTTNTTGGAKNNDVTIFIYLAILIAYIYNLN